MQIACKRYGCQKAVEVCYWTCKYRRNCKDWKGALEGDPGLEAVQERLEIAAAKSGRLFDLATLAKPTRNGWAAPARLPILPKAPLSPESAPGARPQRSRKNLTTRKSKPKEGF